MKTFFRATGFICLFLMASCSNDDNNGDQKLTLPATFENNTALNIPDTPPGVPVYSEINIPNSGTIIDPSKINIELDLEHSFCVDLVIQIVAPDGNATTLLKRYGAGNDLISGNILRFNSTFTNTMISNPIATGNYAPLINQDTSFEPTNISTPSLELFLTNKNIKGIWKIKASDWFTGNVGKLNTWKIKFAEGALK
jgi:subtilisin-like proprotein convertase family protein